MHYNEESSLESITVDGITFNLLESESNTHYIGLSGNQIIKIEVCPNEMKLRTLDEEVQVLKYLNSHNCKSCPRLLAHGKLEDGRPYFIEERIIPHSQPVLTDILLALFEQKHLGVYQGDLHPRNIIFDGKVTYLVDYDQAIMTEEIIDMDEIEFLDWVLEQDIPAYVLERGNLQLHFSEFIRLMSKLHYIVSLSD
ncbi:MAG: hypothetical protein GXY40_08730 [Syntrophomonadaceae bacterium]|jgi:predicted Ser/Thr protein kinase|nr:hypothetical protein [Syntrophomonadaceae bacterium]